MRQRVGPRSLAGIVEIADRAATAVLAPELTGA
jgi:hypothetical protein